MGVGIAQWIEQQTLTERSRVHLPAGVVGECSFPGSTFCACSHFGVCSNPMLLVSTVALVNLPKVQLAGYT